MASILFEILAETKKATASIETFGRNATKTVEGVASSFNALKTLAVGAVGFLGAREIYGFLKESAAAAAESEVALNQLNSALKISGQYSEETSKSLQGFAEQIQATTVYEDDAIIANMALIESMANLSEDGLKQATQAAIDLSSALSIDLETATRMVGKAATGNVAAFAKYGVEIKKGKDDTETFGNALEALNKKFGGAAVAQVNTFTGAMAQLKNNIGNVYEEFGSVITQNPMFTGAIKATNKAVLEIIDSIKANKGNIQDVINALVKGVLGMVPIIINGVALVIDGLNILQKIIVGITEKYLLFMEAMLEIDTVKTIVNAVADAYKSFASVVLKSISTVIDVMLMIPGAAKALDVFGVTIDDVKQLSSDIEGFGEVVKESVGDDIASMARETYGKIRKELVKSSASADSFMSKVSAGIKYLADVAKNVIDNMEAVGAAEKKLKEEIEKPVHTWLDDLIETLTVENFKKLYNDLGNFFTIQNLKSGVDSVISYMSQGLTGAWENIKKAFTLDGIKDIGNGIYDAINGGGKKLYDYLSEVDWSAVATSLGNGIVKAGEFLRDVFSGQWVTQITAGVQMIAGFPKAFLEAIKGLDKVLAEFAASLPLVMDELIKQVPSIVSSVVEKMGEVFDKLAKFMPMLADTIAKSAPIIAGSIIDAAVTLMDSLPEIVDRIAQGLAPLLEKVLQKLPALINSTFAALPKVVKSLADAIPGLVVVLARNLGPVIESLVTGLTAAAPEIVTALVDSLLIEGGLERIVVALVEATPRIGYGIAVGLINGLIQGMQAIGESFAYAFQAAFTNISQFIADEFAGKTFKSFNELVGANFKWPVIPTPNWSTNIQVKTPSWLSDLKVKMPAWLDDLKVDSPPWLTQFVDAIDRLTNWSPGEFGSGGTLGQLSGGNTSGFFEDLNPFASGGVVPKGYPNDTYPAALTSDELVLPSKSASNLFDLIDRLSTGKIQTQSGSGEQIVNVNLKVGEKELASILLNLNRQGYRTA